VVEACSHVVVARSAVEVGWHSLELKTPKVRESASKALLAKLNVVGCLVVAWVEEGAAQAEEV
jgi:hypothetical protein